MAEKKKTSAPVGKKKAAAAAPSKQTMNFVRHESTINVKNILIIAAVLIVALAAFTKFGILDQEAKRLAAYNELSTKQATLSAVNAKLVGYDELAEQYGRYSYGWMNESEKNLVGRMDVVKLIDQYVASAATVEDYAVNENVLTMNIHGVTLDQASQIVKKLENSDIVESAAVYSASAEEAAEARIFMSVILAKEAAE